MKYKYKICYDVLHHPKVNLDLSELSKKHTPVPLFIQKFNEIKDDHSYCTPVYTDGSKDNDRVGCGAIINNFSIKQRLPSNASIFTAEATAIDLALDAITESDDDHFIIFSDSLSVLLSLKNKKMDNPLILKLLQKLHHLSCAHKTVHFCWIPSHIGIRGNEAADVAAKESLSQDIIASQVPYTDLKPHINSFIANKWQERWSSCQDNKLFKIKPTIGVWPSGFRNSRKEEPHKHASIGPAPGRCCIPNRPDAGKTFWPGIGPASFAQRRDIGPMPALRYMP